MDALIQPGQVIKGKYRVERVLGQGGMGVVVAAQHVALDQRVAIKFLHPVMLQHPDIVERFAREARAASKITSDHVARVIDVDALEDGTPFIVMEYLEGSDLSLARKTRRPVPIHLAATYIVEACEAIGEAHRLGIVHRDIKPANLFLAQRGGGKTRTKVLDFGISKMDAPGSQPSVTRTTSVIGSAEYMSPEQMLSTRDVDARTDIWALGVTLYEILTATVPFPGETITQVCAHVMSRAPAAPSTLRADIPADLDAVILRCLEKDRDRRCSSVEELAAALAPFAAGRLSSDAPPAADRLAFAGTLAVDTGNQRPSGWGTRPSNAPALAAPAQAAQAAQPAQAGQGAPWQAGPSTAALAGGAPPAGGIARAVTGPVVEVTAAPTMMLASTTGAISSGPMTPVPTAPAASRAPIAVAIAALAFVALAGVGGVFAIRGSASQSPSSAAAASLPLASPLSPPVAAATPTEAPPAADSSTADAQVPAVSPGSAAPPASSGDAATAPPASADSHAPKAVHGNADGSKPHVSPPAAQPPAPRKVNCSPPYIIDASGIKHAKPECS